MKLKGLLKRNPCVKCDYYHKENETCQSKKCSSNNPYITKFDRMFCEAYHGLSTGCYKVQSDM